MITHELRKRFSIIGNAWIETRDGNRYYRVKTDSGKKYLHRLLYEHRHGAIPDGKLIDHLDGDGLNNADDNMALKGKKGNAKNARMSKSNKSGHTGVYMKKSSGRWIANGKVNGATVYIGIFDDLEDAVTARKEWQRRQGGFTERHGA